MSGKRPAIEFKDVHFAYVKDTPVLKGIDLTIGQGEFITVIGQNGSGKSTLVKHLNGLLEPDEGAVHLYNDNGTAYDTREHSMGTLAGLVGYVFQNPDDQIFHTSVRSEIAYGLGNIGVPENEHGNQIAEVLDAVGLPGQANRNPFNMGKGERQRLAIASILAVEPGVICVDEPTTGQDRQEAADIMEILQSYNDDGYTIIAITHDIALAARYTDRVVVLSDGAILADGPPKEVFRKEAHLEQTNIRPPQITQLYGTLNDCDIEIGDDLWLTVENAHDVISQLYEQSDPVASPDWKD